MPGGAMTAWLGLRAQDSAVDLVSVWRPVATLEAALLVSVGTRTRGWRTWRRWHLAQAELGAGALEAALRAQRPGH